jgi:hypothetical protein
MESSTKPATPTQALYGQLEAAFNFFNERLFGGQLPPCLITLRSASGVYGYHHAGRFVSPQGQTVDELGMHPGFFGLQPVEAVMSTLVHEMVHHWQQHFGQPSPSNPHNRQWADKMLAIGLHPSHTGLPGGKSTGRSMSDYIVPNGPFIQACRDWVNQGFALTWMDRKAATQPEKVQAQQAALKEAGVVLELSPPPVEALPATLNEKPTVWEPPPKAEPTRFKHLCPKCQQAAWASKSASLLCGGCGVAMNISQST